MKHAMFIHDGGIYYPANNNATAVCAIISRMTLKDMDMTWVRHRGYTPILTNGEEIGRVDIKV